MSATEAANVISGSTSGSTSKSSNEDVFHMRLSNRCFNIANFRDHKLSHNKAPPPLMDRDGRIVLHMEREMPDDVALSVPEKEGEKVYTWRVNPEKQAWVIEHVSGVKHKARFVGQQSKKTDKHVVMMIVCNCDSECSQPIKCPKRGIEVTPIKDTYNFLERRIPTDNILDADEMETRYIDMQQQKKTGASARFARRHFKNSITTTTLTNDDLAIVGGDGSNGIDDLSVNDIITSSTAEDGMGYRTSDSGEKSGKPGGGSKGGSSKGGSSSSIHYKGNHSFAGVGLADESADFNNEGLFDDNDGDRMEVTDFQPFVDSDDANSEEEDDEDDLEGSDKAPQAVATTNTTTGVDGDDTTTTTTTTTVGEKRKYDAMDSFNTPNTNTNTNTNTNLNKKQRMMVDGSGDITVSSVSSSIDFTGAPEGLTVDNVIKIFKQNGNRITSIKDLKKQLKQKRFFPRKIKKNDKTAGSIANRVLTEILKSIVMRESDSTLVLKDKYKDASF